MKRITGLIITILLLGYGLIRMGVGALLLAQTLDLINFPDLAEGVTEVDVFLEARVNKQIIPFSLAGYFGYILAMGSLLTAGAIGIITRHRWGFSLLVIYLVMHAALFINYQEINPKLIVLVLQAILLYLLYYLRPPKSEIINDDDHQRHGHDGV